MPYADRGTHRLWYDVTGPADAPPVLLIMGMAFSSRAWDTLPARLAERFRVVTFDNRGIGRSEKPRGFFRVRDMADDAAAVLDAAGIAAAHVFGVSMGGMCALELVLRHRQRVRTLALGCTMAGYRKSTKPAPFVSRLLLASIVKRGLSAAEIAPVLVSDAQFARDPEGFTAWLRRTERGSGAAVAMQMLAVSRHDTAARLATLDVPALVITGDADRLVPPENSRVLAGLIPRARLVELAGAGHCFPYERLDDTDAALRALFATTP